MLLFTDYMCLLFLRWACCVEQLSSRLCLLSARIIVHTTIPDCASKLLLFYFIVVLGIEPRASCILDKHSTTNLQYLHVYF